MSNDTNNNKTQPPDNIKCEMPDLEECMLRLRLISGMKSNPAVMRWLGLSANTYANWSRRRVNYGSLTEALLNKGISLDWFFAPNADLRYPTPEELPRQQEVAEAYSSNARTAKVIRVISIVDAILQEHGVPVTEQNRELMVETYFTARRNFIALPTALNQMAKGLALKQN